MRKPIAWMVTSAFVVLSTAFVFAAERDRSSDPLTYSGKAKLVSSVERGDGTDGIRVGLLVDLTQVSLGGQPAQLGAYVLKISFDPSRVEYVGVAGGADQHFSQSPVATIAAKANANGVVKLAAVANATTGPVGLVSVGSVEFREKSSGGALTIHAELDSLAAPAQAMAGGRPAASPMIDVVKEAR